MKKIALIVVLIAVLVAAGLGTMAAVAQTPALSVKVDSTLTFLRATGSKWTPAQLVSLYWDVEDNAHLVAIAQPYKNGAIAATVPLDGTTPGYHEIIGVQGGTTVAKQFWLPAAEPLDDRTWEVLQGIDTGAANIEAKLDDPATGLVEIKREVANIEANLTSPDYGLGEIKNEVRSIEGKLDNSTYGLARLDTELDGIQNNLTSPTYGLAAIEGLVDDVEPRLGSFPPSGRSWSDVAAALADIKTEIEEIKSELDEVPRADSIEFYADYLYPDSGVYDYGGGHVTLTLKLASRDEGKVIVKIRTGKSTGWFLADLATISDTNFHTYEFDALSWHIEKDGFKGTLTYNATITNTP
jgi:hypothetical protein